MERIINPSHGAASILYSLAKSLERAAYYGLRALLVIYMTSEALKMSVDEALRLYGVFTGSLVVFQIIGALIGDFALGNKKTIIIGAVLQAVGAFCCCLPNIEGLYAGLLLVAIGSGFYTPNIISAFGKQYLDKVKLLDAGFNIFYMAINLGAFLGVIFMGYFGEHYGWHIGFIIAGVLMLLSIIPVALVEEPEVIARTENALPAEERMIKIWIALLAVGIFWTVYEVFGASIYNLQTTFSELFAATIPRSVWQSTGAAPAILLHFIVIIIWTFFYSSQFSKLAIGFFLAAIACTLVLFIPSVPDERYVSFFLVATILLSAAEVFIGPIIYSVLTQYAHPKYLTIWIAISYLPGRLFINLMGLFSLNEGQYFALVAGCILLFVFGVGLLVYLLVVPKEKLTIF